MNKKESKMLRRLAREAEMAINHVGVLNRAQTYRDKRKWNSKNACRRKGRSAWA